MSAGESWHLSCHISTIGNFCILTTVCYILRPIWIYPRLIRSTWTTWRSAGISDKIEVRLLASPTLPDNFIVRDERFTFTFRNEGQPDGSRRGRISEDGVQAGAEVSAVHVLVVNPTWVNAVINVGKLQARPRCSSGMLLPQNASYFPIYMITRFYYRLPEFRGTQWAIIALSIRGCVLRHL